MYSLVVFPLISVSAVGTIALFGSLSSVLCTSWEYSNSLLIVFVKLDLLLGNRHGIIISEKDFWIHLNYVF